jgi:hypothetical protein
LTPSIGEKNKPKLKKIKPRITEIVNKNGFGRSRKLTGGRSKDKELGNFLDVFPLLMQISDLFSKPVTVVDNQIYTSISMGISIYPDDGGDPDTLLQNADRALYFSKQKEYNSFTFYKSEMDMQTTIKRNIVHSLRRAIENNEFTLVYQPKIDLRTGKVSGAEALIRWNNEGTWVSPMDFIPAAEESGLIIPIGKWVLEEAARDTKYIHEKGFENTDFTDFEIEDNMLSLMSADGKTILIPGGNYPVKQIENEFVVELPIK